MLRKRQFQGCLFSPAFHHGVIILNRSNNFVLLIFENLLKLASLWSHPGHGNLNETWNASSPGFFLKILNSVFENINMGLDHKLFLELFLIGFCLFCSRIGKRWVQRFPVISGYCLDDKRDFQTLPGNHQQILAYSWYIFKYIFIYPVRLAIKFHNTVVLHKKEPPFCDLHRHPQ